MRIPLVVAVLALALTAAPASAAPEFGESVPSVEVASGYRYAATSTQMLPADGRSRGLRATFTVHRPGQVDGHLGQHSIGQIAVGKGGTRAFVEAGWRQFVDGPRLFVFWRPEDGSATCYDVGCGFKERGRGTKPGTQLEPGTSVEIGFRFVNRKWWLIVDGKRSGYYPAKLWDGTFTRSDYSLVFGEVYVDPEQDMCADMGSGKRAKSKKAAKVTDVAFYDGPPVTLLQASRNSAAYSVRISSDTSFRYGGPGAC